MARKFFTRKRKTYRRTNRKYGFKRQNKRYQKKIMSSSLLTYPFKQVFPDTFSTKTTWTDSVQTTAVASNASYWALYRGHSVYDPEVITFPNNSALYHKELAAIYGRYRVLASKIYVTVTRIDGTTAESPYRICIFPYRSEDASALSFPTLKIGEAAMLPYAHMKAAITSSKPPSIKGYMSQAKMYGVPKTAIRSEISYSSTTGTNPLFGQEWAVGIQNDAITGNSYKIDIRLTYYVEYFNRRGNADILADNVDPE